MHDGTTNRRRCIGGTAAALLGSQGASAAVSPAGGSLSEPEYFLPPYKAMRGGNGEQAALWWLTGTLYAKLLNGINVPMVRVHGASWNRITTRDDGNLDQAMDEVGFFFDLNDGPRV